MAMLGQTKYKGVIWQPLEKLAQVKWAFRENNVVEWAALCKFKLIYSFGNFQWKKGASEHCKVLHNSWMDFQSQ